MSFLHRFFIVSMGLNFYLLSIGDEILTKSNQPVREVRLLAWSPIGVPLSLGPSLEDPVVNLSTTQLSQYTDLSSGVKVELFTPVMMQDGKLKKIVYASAPWPHDCTRAIGLIGPNASPTDPHGILVLLPDDLIRYSEHRVRILNLTEGQLAVKVGREDSLLETKAEWVTPFDPNGKRLPIVVAVPDGKEGWRRVISTYLTTASHYRSVVILRPNQHPQPGEDTAVPVMLQLLDQTSPLPPEVPRPAPIPENVR